MAGWRFQRRTERGDGSRPAWLTAPGIEKGVPTALDPWSEPVEDWAAPPPPPRRPPPSHHNQTGDAAPVVGPVGEPMGGPATSWGAPGDAPDRVRDEMPLLPPAPFHLAAHSVVAPAGTDEYRTQRPGGVVAMQAGHRFTVDDGTQLWIGGDGLPTDSAPLVVPAAVARPLDQHRRRRAAAGRAAPLRARALDVLARPAVSGQELLERSVAALDPVSEAEAAAFAARFAADYLSYDEDDPTLRAQVLRTYLADPSAATLGWSGVGRQRAEIVLPGRTLRTAEGVVVVEVTARVTPYHRTGPRFAEPDPPGELPPRSASTVGPACAPSPSTPGWVADPAQWVRIAPPVRRDTAGTLVIDIGPATAPGEPSDPRRHRSDLHEPDPGLGDPEMGDVAQGDAR